MNKEVNFEIAKLLKEKGFILLPDFKSSYPTIAEVVMWFYEKHGIWISVQKYWDKGEFLGWEALIYFSDGIHITKTVNSPTEAYEVAIKHTLENKIQGGNNDHQ